jgi:hypothetical protein
MPDDNIAQSRKIMLSGRAAGGLAPDTAISFVDDAGNTLPRAGVDVDGRCEVHETAPSSAKEVPVESINVSLRAQQLPALVETENALDVAARLRAGSVAEAPVEKRGMTWDHDRKRR